MIETTRRSFITGLMSLVAAPAIVRAGSLMPVKVLEAAAYYPHAEEIQRQTILVLSDGQSNWTLPGYWWQGESDPPPRSPFGGFESRVFIVAPGGLSDAPRENRPYGLDRLRVRVADDRLLAAAGQIKTPPASSPTALIWKY